MATQYPALITISRRLLCKKNLVGIPLFLMIFSFNLELLAQDVPEDKNQISLFAELRPRFEMRQGYLKPLPVTANPALGVNNRLRLGILYKHKNRLRFGITMQNVNIWGQSPQVTVMDYTGNLSVYEAWGSLDIGKIEFIVGRQAFNLDNQRLFSTLDWMPGGRAHDGISLKYKDQKGFFKLHGFFAYNQNYKVQIAQTGSLFPTYNVLTISNHYYNTSGAQPYQNMQLLWGNFAWKKQKLSLLFINLGLQNALRNPNGTWRNLAMHFMQTLGFYYTLNNGHLLLDLEGYAQLGRNITGAESKAFLVAGFVGYKHKGNIIVLGTDYLSGNPDSRYKKHQGVANTNYAFDPLYGLHHKYYGNMDNYYIAADPMQFGVGIWDKYISLAHNFQAINTNLKLSAHWLHSSGTILNAQNLNIGRDLGQELDLSFRYDPHEFVRVLGGYSVYFTTDAQNVLKGVLDARTFQHWFWLSISFTPTLFSTKF